MVEQSDAVPKQDGHQVYVYLVEESRSDALLHDARGAHAVVRGVVVDDEEREIGGNVVSIIRG